MLIVSGVGMSWAGEPVTRSDRSFRNDRAQGSAVYGLAVWSDGRIWAGGDFTRLGGGSVTNLALLEADGSLVPGFVSALEPSFIINSVITEPDGGCLVAGDGPNNVPQPNAGRGEKVFFRVRPDRRIDPGFPGWTNSSATVAFRVVRLADGGSLLTSLILSETESSGGLVRRFSTAGEWDSSFASNLVLVGVAQDVSDSGGTLPDGGFPLIPPRVMDVLSLPDGDFLVGGFFGGVIDWVSHGLVKISSTGEVRRDWSSPLTNFSSVFRLIRQQDGSVLAGGRMMIGDSTNAVHFIRLRPDLSLDEEFRQPRIGSQTLYFDGVFSYDATSVLEISLLPDGRIIVGRVFDTVDGYWRRGICVFLADGTVDPSVETGRGAGILSNPIGLVTRLVPHGSGRVLASGTLRGFDFDERPLLMDLILGTDGPLARLSVLTGSSSPEIPASPLLWAFLPKGTTGYVQESTNLVDWRTVHEGRSPEIQLSLTNAVDNVSAVYTRIPNIQRAHPNVFYRLMTQPE
jgi:hypothetical protein